MGRQIRSTVPQLNNQLTPNWSYLSTFREKNAEFKARQKDNFDKRHKVQDSSVLLDDTEVWVTTGPGTESEPVRGTITTSTGSPSTQISQNFNLGQFDNKNFIRQNFFEVS